MASLESLERAVRQLSPPEHPRVDTVIEFVGCNHKAPVGQREVPGLGYLLNPTYGEQTLYKEAPVLFQQLPEPIHVQPLEFGKGHK